MPSRSWLVEVVIPLAIGFIWSAIAPSLAQTTLDNAISEQRSRAQQSLDEANELLKSSQQAGANQSDPPRLYLQVPPGYPNAESIRLHAEAASLGQQQVIAPTVTLTRNSPLINELRFFHRSEKDEAMSLAAALDIPQLFVSDLSSQYEQWNDIRPRRYELWVRSPSEATLTDAAASDLQGRWTIGALTTNCQTHYYLWTFSDAEMVFTDDRHQVDREKITERLPTGFLAETVESHHTPGGTPAERIGEKWEFRYKSTSSFAVQRMSNGSGFALTKC